MKFQLTKSTYTAEELSKLNFLANYNGYIFKYNADKQAALFETEEHNVGYVQKDENDRLFIVWKFDESIEYVEQLINIACNIRGLLKLPTKLKYLVDMLTIQSHEIIHLQHG